jgi:hypothetical protein
MRRLAPVSLVPPPSFGDVVAATRDCAGSASGAAGGADNAAAASDADSADAILDNTVEEKEEADV